MSVETRLVNIAGLKQEIQAKLPIEEVAERLCEVELSVSGVQLKGLCPLHDEDTPSFYVSPSKGLYKCFGCDSGGDAIDLVRRYRNLSFHEALQVLATVALIDLSRYERPATEAEQEMDQLRKWLRSFLDQAANTARSHGEAVPRHRMGQHGLDPGLSIKRPSGAPPSLPDYYFENTEVYPYRLPSGAPVGFKARQVGGKARQMGSDGSWMTPSSFPLHAPTLYGIEVAREHVKDHGGRLQVVEGEHDCHAMHAAGFPNTVAASGSLTDEHMKMLRDHHVKEVVLLFDADTAGDKHTARVCEAWWDAEGILLRVATLPAGKDPDDVVSEDSSVGQIVAKTILATAIQDAKHGLEWLLWQKWNEKTRTDLSGKYEFVDWIRETYGDRLRSIHEAILIHTVAGWLQVPEVDLHDFIKAETGDLMAEESEACVLGQAIRNTNYFIEARRILASEDFFFIHNQRVWRLLEELFANDTKPDVPTLKTLAAERGLDPEKIGRLVGQPETNLPFHETRVLDMALRRQARDEALALRDKVMDPSVRADTAIGAFTQSVTQKVLKRDGGAARIITEQVDHAMGTLHERMANPTEVHGLHPGAQWDKFARTLQGFQPGRFVLLTASSGVGKSTMCIQWVTSFAVHQSVPMDFISLEMDEVEILFKMASHLTGIDSMAITGGALDEDQAKRVERAMIRIRKSPLRIYAPDSLTPTEMLLYAREQRMDRRSEMFVLDYAQLMSPDPGMERQSGYDQLGHFGRIAKMRVARGMETCFVCVAQLKREAAEKERPTKEDIGDSYQLTRDCDVFLILKGSDDSDQMDLWVDKNRQGTSNVLIPLIADRPNQTFYEMHSGVREPDYRVRPA